MQATIQFDMFDSYATTVLAKQHYDAGHAIELNVLHTTLHTWLLHVTDKRQRASLAGSLDYVQALFVKLYDATVTHDEPVLTRPPTPHRS